MRPIRLNTRLALISIIIITGLTYANSLNNKFVGDDFIVLEDNNFIKAWKNFSGIFNRKYLNTGKGHIASGEISYRPVVTISYFIDYALL